MNKIIFIFLLAISLVFISSDAYAQSLEYPIINDDDGNPLTIDFRSHTDIRRFVDDCTFFQLALSRCITTGTEITTSIFGDAELTDVTDNLRWYIGNTEPVLTDTPLYIGSTFQIPDDIACTARITIIYPDTIVNGVVTLTSIDATQVVGFQSEECLAPFGPVRGDSALGNAFLTSYENANTLEVRANCVEEIRRINPTSCTIDLDAPRPSSHHFNGFLTDLSNRSLDENIRWYLNDPDRSEPPLQRKRLILNNNNAPFCGDVNLLAEWPSSVVRGVPTEIMTRSFDITITSVACVARTPPVAPDFIFTAELDVPVTIDFNGVFDDIDSLEDLNIVFDLNSQNVTGPANIFTQIGHSGIESFALDNRRTVLSHPVVFRVDSAGMPGFYSFAYVVTDVAGNSNSGRITLVIPSTGTNDNTAPTSPSILGIVNLGDTLNLDLSDIQDLTSNSNLSVTFDTDNPSATGGNILEHGSFTTNVAGDDGPSFTVRDLGQTVQFIPDSDAVPGIYTFPYTATDEFGNTASNDISVRIGVGLDTTPPTTDLITSTITRGTSDIIDFSTVTDNENSFDELTITFNIGNPHAADSILTQGSFEDGATRFGQIYTVNSQTVTFKANPGNVDKTIDNIQYTATDKIGNKNSGLIEINFIADDVAPTASLISFFVAPDESMTIHFSGLTDNLDTFNQLRITFNTADGALGGNILEQGRFTTGAINFGSDTEFRVISPTVKFIADSDATLGTYSFNYIVFDRAGQSSTDRINITIYDPSAPVPDAVNITPAYTRVLDSNGSPLTSLVDGSIVLFASECESLVDGCIVDDMMLNAKLSDIPDALDQVRWYKGGASDATGTPLAFGAAFTIPDDFDCTERITVRYPTSIVRGVVTVDETASFVVGFKSAQCPAPYGLVADNDSPVTYSDADTISINNTCESGAAENNNCVINRGGSNTFTGTIPGATTSDSIIRWYVNDPDRSDTPHIIGNTLALGDDFPVCGVNVIAEWPSDVDTGFVTELVTSSFNIIVPDSSCPSVATGDPIALNFTSFINTGESVTIDFSSIVIDDQSFSGLSIVLLTGDASSTGGNILEQGVFTGLTGTGPDFTVDDTIITFTVPSSTAPGLFTFPYRASDSSNNQSSGTISFTIIDTTKPTTPILAFNGNLQDQIQVSFADVTDNAGSFPALSIILSFDPADTTGPNDAFNLGSFFAASKFGFISIVNNLNEPFFVSPSFEHNPVGVYTIPYNATDAAGNFNTGIVILTIEDKEAPSTPDILDSVKLGESTNIDFSVVTDDAASFEHLIITFDTDDPNAGGSILDNGNFSSGVNSTSTPFRVNATMVTFNANSDAISGNYTIPYSATDTLNNTTLGTITIMIQDNIPPTTPDIRLVTTGDNHDIRFDVVTDNDDSGDDIKIFFEFGSPDAVRNIDDGGRFLSGDFNVSGERHNLNSRIVTFTVSANAVPGTYSFPYTATDSADNSNTGTVTIIIGDANPPETPSISASINQGESGNLHFNTVTDDASSFEELIITFNTDDPDATPFILRNGTFSMGTNNTDPDNITQPFRVTDRIVTFDVNPDASVFSTLQPYSIPYTATDTAGRSSSSTISIRILDTTPPTANDYAISVTQGEIVTIDFNNFISDNFVDFRPTLTLLLDDPTATGGNILDQGVLTNTELTDEHYSLRSTIPTFTAKPDAVPGLYTFLYRVVDTIGLVSSARLSITIDATLTNPGAPNTSDISALVDPDAFVDIDFSVITDDTDSFEDLMITFTAGSILEHGNFTSGTTFSNSIYTVTSETVRFTADSDAALGVYFIGFTATNQENKSNNDVLTIIIDDAPPATPDVSTFVNPGGSNSLNFGIVTDDAYSFDDLIITFDTNVSGDSILRSGVFLSGADGIGSKFTVNSQTVTFRANPDATTRIFELPYTVTDGAGHSSTGRMFISIGDDEAPTSMDISTFMNQGESGDLNFRVVTDTLLSFDQLVITFDTDAPTATPFILENGTFTSGTDSTDMTPFRLTDTGGIVTFTANPNAASGVYTIPYTVTDRGGLSSSSTITITIFDVTIPVIPTIPVSFSVNPGSNIPLDFSTITDDTDDDLRITIRGSDLFDLKTQGTFRGFTEDNSNFVTSSMANDVDYAVNPNVADMIYPIPYNATDSAGNIANGTAFISIGDDENPDTMPISVSVTPGNPVDLDFFGNVTDDLSSPEQLIIIFDTDDPNAVGDILGNGAFSASDVASTSAPFRVNATDGIVVFTANADADAGAHTIPYTATDRGGRSNSNTITIAISDISAPVVPDLAYFGEAGGFIIIDFSDITDDFDSFEELIITFDTDDPAATPFILRNGTFSSTGLNGTSTPFGVTAQMVRFDVRSNADGGIYTLPYTVTDRGNHSTDGTITMIIDNDPPTTPNIKYLIDGEQGVYNLDFRGIENDNDRPAVTDDADSLEELTITFDTDDPRAIGLLGNGTFVSGVNGSSTPFGVTAPVVAFRANPDAELAAEFIMPYTATDRSGRSSSGTLSLTIVDFTPPTGSDIRISIRQGQSGVISFENTADDYHSLSQLIHVYFLPNELAQHGRFVDGDNNFFLNQWAINGDSTIFSANFNATLGEYKVGFRVSDGNVYNNQHFLDVFITILAATPDDTIAPIAPSILGIVNLGDTLNLDLSDIQDLTSNSN